MTRFPATNSRRRKAFNEMAAEPAISRPYLLRYFGRSRGRRRSQEHGRRLPTSDGRRAHGAKTPVWTRRSVSHQSDDVAAALMALSQSPSCEHGKL